MSLLLQRGKPILDPELFSNEVKATVLFQRAKIAILYILSGIVIFGVSRVKIYIRKFFCDRQH